MMSAVGNRSITLLVAGVAVANAALASGWTAHTSAAPAPKPAPVLARPNNGTVSGRVEFVPLDDTVLIEAAFIGLVPGRQYSASLREFPATEGRGCEGVGGLLDPLGLSASPTYRPDPTNFATAAVGDLSAKFGAFQADRNGAFEFRGLDSSFAVGDVLGQRSFMLESPDGAICAAITATPPE